MFRTMKLAKKNSEQQQNLLLLRKAPKRDLFGDLIHGINKIIYTVWKEQDKEQVYTNHTYIYS